MRAILVLSALAAAMILSAPRGAEATTWCAIESDQTTCGFATFQQCRDFAAGTGAFCDVDHNPRTTAPSSRKK